jgi:hypothetical protein
MWAEKNGLQGKGKINVVKGIFQERQRKCRQEGNRDTRNETVRDGR